MPTRRRRADEPRSRWRSVLRQGPLVVLFVLGALSGVFLWAYAPDLPRDYLVERYGQPPSTFIDVGGTRAPRIEAAGAARERPRRLDAEIADITLAVIGQERQAALDEAGRPGRRAVRIHSSPLRLRQ